MNLLVSAQNFPSLNPISPGVGPQPRANAYTCKKSMGGNSYNFCIFLNKVREKPFHGQTTFRLVEGSLNWSKTPYISRTKCLRHQKLVSNWSLLQKLNFKPIFEQVTPSRPSGKKEKALRHICPTPGVIRSKKCGVMWGKCFRMFLWVLLIW